MCVCEHLSHCLKSCGLCLCIWENIIERIYILLIQQQSYALYIESWHVSWDMILKNNSNLNIKDDYLLSLSSNYVEICLHKRFHIKAYD